MAANAPSAPPASIAASATAPPREPRYAVGQRVRTNGDFHEGPITGVIEDITILDSGTIWYGIRVDNTNPSYHRYTEPDPHAPEEGNQPPLTARAEDQFEAIGGRRRRKSRKHKKSKKSKKTRKH
jgi:hypothetical protein